jgi:IS30 family transposase
LRFGPPGRKRGVENANGCIRRWLPRTADLDTMTEADIQEIAMTLNLTPRKCLGFKSPVEAFLHELGKDVDRSFHHHVALRE